MRILCKLVICTLLLTAHALKAEQSKVTSSSLYQQYRVSEYIHWYPAIEQLKMKNEWLKKHDIGTWSHSGLVGADDRTVITPQADVNYGYNWFNISNGPMVIELPKYDMYSSLSIFDMNHFIEDVIVNPSKPIVVRLANQKNPIKNSHDVVLTTNSGLLFLRMVIPSKDKEEKVLNIAKNIKTTGGNGTEPFIIPEFTEAERNTAMKMITDYGLKQKNANRLFGKTSQGVGDLDRAAGVFLGQLGIPADFVQYVQYVNDENGNPLGGDGSYQININPKGLIRDAKGYWSITVYNMEDRYLIKNSKEVYSITSYTAAPNSDGSFTIRINPKGKGTNAIPTAGKPIYAVMRVYQPNGMVEFPPINTK